MGQTQNSCLQLDGDYDFVAVPSLLECFPNLTIEMWVNRSHTDNFVDGLFGNQGWWSCGDLHYQIDRGDPAARWHFNVACGSQESWSGIDIPEYEWCHLAVTYEQGQEVVYYYNGQEAIRVPTEGDLCANLNQADLSLGCTHSSVSDRYFRGKMDDFRIWDYIRSPEDISGNMSEELSGSESGLVLYYNFNTPSGSTVIDLSPNHFDGTLSGDAVIVECNDLILPVDLLSFDAVSSDGAIRLSFSTASESSNDHFEIWKGEDADEGFALLTLITSQGNTASGHSYEYVDRDVEAGETYWYYLVDVDLNGNRTEHRNHTLSATAGVSSEVPASYSLTAYPNPFNPATTISFSLPDAEFVRVTVFDLTGREVALLLDKPVSSGQHHVTFNATGLPSGIYLVQLQAGEMKLAQKVALVK